MQAIEDGEEAVNHNFIRQALQPIVSMLLEQLTKQEPGQERDEGIWNLSMAAATCLGLVAQCVRDEIVGLVMPYVQVSRCAILALSSTQQMFMCFMHARYHIKLHESCFILN